VRDSVDGVSYRRFPTHWDSRLLKYSQLVRDALGIRRAAFSSDLWYPGYALRVALDLRERDCAVVHVYNYPQFAALIKRFNPQLRVVLNMHGEILTQVPFRNLKRRLEKLDLVITCSEFVARPLRHQYPQIADRCKTVPMGLSPEALSCGRHSSSNYASPRRVLYVGRLSPEKGVHVLLEAFELMLLDYPDASLDVVGPEWVLPREYISDLCLEPSIADSFKPFYRDSYTRQLRDSLSSRAAKRVNFVGLVPHAEIPNYYAGADVYVNPSFYESFGMSIIEAMAAGLPVVATRAGAVSDLISDGHNGLLVDTANPVAIANAVGNLFSNAGLRNSITTAASETVCTQFSWETICSSLMRMYQDVVLGETA
jgi:glycosyltransferase involved in cell wall biosynthesis